MDGSTRQSLSANEACSLAYTFSEELRQCVRATTCRLPMPKSPLAALPSEVESDAQVVTASLRAIRRSMARDREYVDDIITESLIALTRRAAKVDDEGRHVPLLEEEVRPYLFKVTRRIAWKRGLMRVAELGARMRFGVHEADGEALSDLSSRPDLLIEQKEEHERLQVVLSELQPKERLLLDAWMEGSYEDALQNLGISYGAARKRISALLTRICRKLGHERILDARMSRAS